MRYSFFSAFKTALVLIPVVGAAQTEAPEIQVNCQDQSQLIIPIEPGSAISINTDSSDPASAGDVELSAAVDFSCSPDGAGQVSFDTVDGARPLSVGSAESVSVPEGALVRFDWESRGAFACDGVIRDAEGQVVRNWAPAPIELPRGPLTVGLVDDDGNTLPVGEYSASVRCRNGGPSLVSGPVSLSVTGTDIPQECQGRQPLNSSGSGLMEIKAQCSLDSDLVDCKDYSSVFGPFPGINTASRNLFANLDEYWAMKIETGATIDATNGFWDFTEPQQEINASGPRILTLSQCAGDFDREAIEEEMTGTCYVKTSGFTTTIRWQRPGETGTACVIEPDSTYYFNVLYTSDPAGTRPSELQWSCGGDSNACANSISSRF